MAKSPFYGGNKDKNPNLVLKGVKASTKWDLIYGPLLVSFDEESYQIQMLCYHYSTIHLIRC